MRQPGFCAKRRSSSCIDEDMPLMVMVIMLKVTIMTTMMILMKIMVVMIVTRNDDKIEPYALLAKRFQLCTMQVRSLYTCQFSVSQNHC